MSSSNNEEMRQRLASFCSRRAPVSPRHPFAGDASARKTSQDFGCTGGRGETGFLPDIQKPVPPRWFRLFARCRQLTICMDACNSPKKSLKRPRPPSIWLPVIVWRMFAVSEPTTIITMGAPRYPLALSFTLTPLFHCGNIASKPGNAMMSPILVYRR